MDEIKDVVSSVVGHLAENRQQKGRDLSAIWERCAGKKLSAHTSPEGVNNGTLHVLVDCSAWKYQCRILARGILIRIKKECPDVKKLFFKIGKV